MAEKIPILVVEDDDQIRETIIHHLSNQGHDALGAADGNEAIPLIHGREFRLIVLDIKMPYINGMDVLKFVKSTFPQTKVIILSAYADLKTSEQCKALGAEEVIGKPYDLEDLLDTVERLTRESDQT